MSSKYLKLITQTLLLSVIAITPFVKISSLYFPFISGRAYVFRFLVAAAFFFWVWMIMKEARSKRQETRIDFRNVLVVALLLFFAAQVFASFFGVDPLFSFFSSISRADGVVQQGFWLTYFLMLVSLFRESWDWKIFFSVFITAAFIISLFAWLGFPPSQEIYGNLFGNPAYFSAFLIFAAGFSLSMFWGRTFRNAFLNNLFLLAAVFFATTLIFTKVRGAFIGLAGGIFLFCLLSVLFLREKNKKLAYSAGIFLLSGFILLVSLFYARETAFVKDNQFLSRLTEVTRIQEPGSVRERLLVWQIAFKAFQDKPVLGWGPENFPSAFNKHYSHFVGEREVWFDRTHNTPLDILTGGGLFLFSFYLLWLGSVVFLIFKIARQEKILSFILASVFFAYFLQGLFFFDTFASFLGLFPFLAYLIYLNYKLQITRPFRARLAQLRWAANHKQITNSPPFRGEARPTALGGKFQTPILVAAAVFSLFIIYVAVIMPWKANAAALQFYTHTEAGLYQEAKPFLKDAFAVRSPYTYWELRKESGWQFLRILEDRIGKETQAKDIQPVEEIYDFIVPEIERFIERRPQEPQMYYVLGRIYLAGFEKLGRDDLKKAEIVLRKAMALSNLRKEYFEELKRALILRGKSDEAEKLLLDYLKRVDFYDYYPYLVMGRFYFETDDYEQALEQYEKAIEKGYDLCRAPVEYTRYLMSAEKRAQYQKVVEVTESCIKKRIPDAKDYFNLALSYFQLGEKEKAKEFFLKAVELNAEYEKYRGFFAP